MFPRHCERSDPSTLAAQATPGWESAEARRAKAEAIQLPLSRQESWIASSLPLLATTNLSQTFREPKNVDGRDKPGHDASNRLCVDWAARSPLLPHRTAPVLERRPHATRQPELVDGGGAAERLE